MKVGRPTVCGGHRARLWEVEFNTMQRPALPSGLCLSLKPLSSYRVRGKQMAGRLQPLSVPGALSHPRLLGPQAYMRYRLCKTSCPELDTEPLENCPLRVSTARALSPKS